MSQTFMWTHLLHLGCNMWNEEGNTRGREHRSNSNAFPTLHFERELWDEHILALKGAGVNALIIDVGEAMRYESHPELAVEGSWTHEEMRKEVDRLRSMGFEVIPKLNFSAAHDIWLKEYSRMLSTPVYYQVCKDIIEEVCAVFCPKYFHIGMDEEDFRNQRNFDFVVVRQFDLWWKDFYYLVDLVEKQGARPWIWSDYMWAHPDLFLRRMPKSVIQSNWYYGGEFENPSERNEMVLRCFEELDRHGFDQVPAGSVFSTPENFERLTRYCTEHISPQRFLGMMQTTWERIDPDWMHTHRVAEERIAAAKRWYDAK
ncbi:MAG: Tat pathway signal protein [Clostridia bacterium]|nr:Tat pathway signal protein [Clostridia bacterium]